MTGSHGYRIPPQQERQALGSENLTYHEKKALGFGTVKERLGKETVKDFDACGLGLQHALDPVVTPEGVLYDREHILGASSTRRRTSRAR